MLTESHIRALLEFMKRVQLSGQEAPMFIECIKALGETLENMQTASAASDIHAAAAEG